MFNTLTAATTGMGRAILNPSNKRAGPTLDFDDDEPPCDETEMEGEEERRRKRRVVEGGVGQLDFVPVRDFEGFGERRMAGEGRRKAVKKELEFEGDGSLEGEQESSEPPEPETMDPTMELHDSQPSSQSQPFSPPTFSRRLPNTSGSFILAPDSDDEPLPLANDSDDDDDAFARLALTHGAGGPDDSGFAEATEVEDVKLQNGTAKMPWERDESLPMEDAEDDAVVEDSQAPFPSLVPHRSQKPTITLGRSASALIMPPPPLPPRRASSPSTLLAPDTIFLPSSQPESDASAFAAVDDHALASETQETLLAPDTLQDTQWRREESQVDDVVLAEETQNSVPLLPLASTSTSVSVPAPAAPAPAKANLTAWSGIASAWAGQQIVPPSPPKPRQTSIHEFFAGAPGGASENDDDEAVIEDSQFGVGFSVLKRAVEDAKIRAKGLELGVGERRGLHGVREEEEEEVEDEEEEVFDDDEVVPSSDPEDGPFTPLTSPIRVPKLPFDVSPRHRPAANSQPHSQQSRSQRFSQAHPSQPSSGSQPQSLYESYYTTAPQPDSQSQLSVHLSDSETQAGQMMKPWIPTIPEWMEGMEVPLPEEVSESLVERSREYVARRRRA
ncbi:hypothetical protein MNV49_002538 [Pseudohyphozyma bogoriensis]|nr:hypothetical protein MNV49_002538 [Pseudohyphozyma bogoriensis]